MLDKVKFYFLLCGVHNTLTAKCNLILQLLQQLLPPGFFLGDSLLL